MKVKDLIKQLKSFDPEIPIYGHYHDYDGRCGFDKIPDDAVVFEYCPIGTYSGIRHDFILLSEVIE